MRQVTVYALEKVSRIPDYVLVMLCLFIILLNTEIYFHFSYYKMVWWFWCAMGFSLVINTCFYVSWLRYFSMGFTHWGSWTSVLVLANIIILLPTNLCAYISYGYVYSGITFILGLMATYYWIFGQKDRISSLVNLWIEEDERIRRIEEFRNHEHQGRVES